MDTVALRSAVHFVPYPKAEEAAAHFSSRLAYETDCSDVWAAIERGADDFLLADCRPGGNYAKLHIPGAVSLPWRDITAERVGRSPGPSYRDVLLGAVLQRRDEGSRSPRATRSPGQGDDRRSRILDSRGSSDCG